jgi:hypothetical protein
MSFMDTFGGGLVSLADTINAHAQQVTRVDLGCGLVVEAYKPSLSVVSQVSGMAIFIALVRTCEQIYPDLIERLRLNSMFVLQFTGDVEAHRGTDAKAKRMALLMTAARKLLQGQEWVWNAEVGAWICPAYMGGDILISEVDLRAEFDLFIQTKLISTTPSGGRPTLKTAR